MWSKMMSFVGVQVLLVIAIAALVSMLEYFCLFRRRHHYQSSQKLWRQAFVEAVHHPIQTLIWLLATCKIAAQFHSLSTDVIIAKKVIVSLVVLWFFIRFVSAIERIFIETEHSSKLVVKDKTRLYAFAQIARVFAIIIVTLSLLPTLGISISALLTFGGVAGVAFGFAAKDTLANFLGGLMIYWDRPFSVGDWIKSPDRKIEGTVEKIGWRLTLIRTFDKRALYVPNALFSNVILVNPSRQTHRRIVNVVGLRYEDADKVDQVTAAIEAMLRLHPGIDSQATIFAKLMDYGPSSLNCRVYAFTNTTNWIEYEGIRQDVLVKISQIVAELGADFAFPTRTVHLQGDAPA